MSKLYASQSRKICIQRRFGQRYIDLNCFSPKWRTGILFDSVANDDYIHYRVVVHKKRGLDKILKRVRVVPDYSYTESSDFSFDSSPNNKNTSTSTDQFQSLCPAGYAEEVIRLVNSIRNNAGVQALGYNIKLAAAADIHSRSNATAELLTHDGWAQEIISTGFLFSSISQNIASIASTPDVVVNLWMNSPSHRDNLLRADLTLTGVSCSPDKNGLLYWTQNFGTPLNY